MLRMRLRTGLERGRATVMATAAALALLTATAGAPAAHAAGKTPALLVLPIATDETVPASTAASLRTAIEAQLKSAGVRVVAAAKGAPTALASVDAIRGAAVTAGADGVLGSRLERDPASDWVRLSLEIQDGESGARVWRSSLAQPDVAGLRGFLPEILGEAARAARDLPERGGQVAPSASAAAASAPAPAMSSTAPAAATEPRSSAATSGGVVIGAAAGAAAGTAAAATTAAVPTPAPPTIHVQPDLPEPVVLNTAPRIEPPLPLAAAAAPQLPPSAGFTLDMAVRDFDVCRFGPTAPIGFVVIDDGSARILVGEGTSLPDTRTRIESRTLETFVAADCADVDGDGIDEIAIAGRRNGGWRSRIWKVLEDGRKVAAIGDEVPFAIRAASTSAGTRVLFAQDFPIPGRLYGPIRAVEMRSSGVFLGRELDLPGDANVGALALGLPGPAGGDATLTIDGDARLRLVAGGRAIATAPAHYGGYDVSFETGEHYQSTTGSLPRVFLRDRIEVVERGASPLVLVTEIESPLGNVLPNLNVGRDVTVTALRWAGQSFAPIPLPFGMGPEAIGEGSLRDIRVADVTGDRVPDLVVGVVDSEGGTFSFSSAAGRIVVFPGTPGAGASAGSAAGVASPGFSSSAPLTDAARSAQ
ncbi:MAG: hypothetical protein IPK07_21175 [Deltaproteobacteria bacterium]|nr:hypothetical protein [Deltaproteobacteria bacterium]